MPEFGGDPCGACVKLKQVADRPLRQWIGAPAAATEEVRAGVGRPDIHIGTQEPLAPSVERMPVCVAALEPPDPDLISAHVADFHERSLSASETMAVHEIEQEQVANIRLRNLREEGLHLFACEELDGLLSRRPPFPWRVFSA